MDARPQGLGEFAEKCVQTFAAQAEVQNVKLELADLSQNCTVSFDQEKLEKIMMNLLSNAFYHTSAGDTITISIAPPLDETISIHVKDTGIGMEEQHLPYLFDRFYQIDPHNGKGSGVGLALTKQLVELHRGSIAVKSTTEVGTIFSVTLPLQQPHVAPFEDSLPTAKDALENHEFVAEHFENGDRRCVLVIEDHDEVRQYLQELLEDRYKVLTANDGLQGIALAEQHSPDLIISDIMMPHKDGLELTTHLKQYLPTSHIPIVLLTAKASMEQKLLGLQTGADDYLSKPFHAHELLQRCHNLIVQRNQLRALFSDNRLIPLEKLTKNHSDQCFLEKAVKIIEEHLDETEFTVEAFCRELAFNRSGVHLKLKALTGNNTTQFIKSVKLRKAAALLRTTDNAITEIATMTGFKTRQTFNKSFKEHFYLTPSEFRKEKTPE